MNDSRGPRPPELSELVRAEDRISFIYAEHAIISRDANAVTITDDRGTVHLPTATLGVLLLGPGTRVTHQAMVVIAESGSTVVWVGENGVRYYAHGRGLTDSSRYAEAQARIFSNQSGRLRVARRMYEMRFPGEDVGSLTMQQLRGREGARVRRFYKEQAKRTGVGWARRDYRPDDFDASDAINQALSAANTSLYGVVHAVIVAVGCIPSLGFVHVGHARSFVYDIADLYKADVSIPASFDVVAAGPTDIAGEARRAVRDRMRDGKLLERCVRDIRELLSLGEDQHADQGDVVKLWSGGSAPDLASGTNHEGGDGGGAGSGRGGSGGGAPRPGLGGAALGHGSDGGDSDGSALGRDLGGGVGTSGSGGGVQLRGGLGDPQGAGARTGKSSGKWERSGGQGSSPDRPPDCGEVADGEAPGDESPELEISAKATPRREPSEGVFRRDVFREDAPREGAPPEGEVPSGADDGDAHADRRDP